LAPNRFSRPRNTAFSRRTQAFYHVQVTFERQTTKGIDKITQPTRLVRTIKDSNDAKVIDSIAAVIGRVMIDV
jgi:hypothetical protein